MAATLENLQTEGEVDKREIVASIRAALEAGGYEIVEVDEERPWGAFFRIANRQADDFIYEFFPRLNAQEARRGIHDMELSPKILLVSPAQRLSWQYHNRRAECWRFLTPGAYHQSATDEQGDVIVAAPKDTIQFEENERHRLVGVPGQYVLVAEIWQHTDRGYTSDEEDIVRLQDDYKRS